MSDIKNDLNYRMTFGHRAWRNLSLFVITSCLCYTLYGCTYSGVTATPFLQVLHRLGDAHLVEEFDAKVDDKVKLSFLPLCSLFSYMPFSNIWS